MATEQQQNATITDGELVAKLREILENWPLYRVYRYSGSDWSFLPEEVSLFCHNTKCKKDQLWKTDIYYGSQFSSPSPDKGGFKEKKYTCKNCEKNVVRYFLYWQGNKTSSVFRKAGQYPPLQIEPPARIAKKLGSADLELYRKALTSRNNSFGLGALAYLRRVVENRMNDLLDLLRAAACRRSFGTAVAT